MMQEIVGRTPRAPVGGFPAGLLLAGLLALTGCMGYSVPANQSAREAARAASGREDWVAALDYWRQAIREVGEEDPEPYREAARALIALGEIESAQLMLDRGIEKFPDDVELRVLCAELLCDRGFRRAAELNYRVAVREDPGRADAWLRLAEVQLDLELPANARLAIERHIELVGKSTRSLYLLGRVLAETGDLDGAMASFAESFEGDVEDLDQLVLAAAVVTEERYSGASQEKLDLACSWVDRVLELDPQNAEASYVKGMILEQGGDDLGAVEAYERAAELVNHLLAMTRLAQAYARLGEIQRADDMIDRALLLNVHASHRRMLERVRRAWH